MSNELNAAVLQQATWTSYRNPLPEGLLPNELTPTMPDEEMQRAEWDHIPSDEELEEPMVDGWVLVKVAVWAEDRVYAYYERKGPDRLDEMLAGYRAAMVDKKQAPPAKAPAKAAATTTTKDDKVDPRRTEAKKEEPARKRSSGTVNATQPELEAAARIVANDEPGVDFDTLCEEDPGRIQNIVDKIRKGVKAGDPDPNESRSVIHEKEIAGPES